MHPNRVIHSHQNVLIRRLNVVGCLITCLYFLLPTMAISEEAEAPAPENSTPTTADVSSSRVHTAPFKSWREGKPEPHPPFQPKEPEKITLENGLTVLLLPDEDTYLMNLTLMVKAGSLWDPPTKIGLAQVTSEMIRIGGSQKTSGRQMQEELEATGSEMGVNAFRENLTAGITVMPEHFSRIAGQFADVLLNPSFPEEKLEAVVSQYRTQIAGRNKRSFDIARREFRKAVFGDNNPYSRNADYGTLSVITQNDLKQFHAEHFKPNRCILGLVGPFDPKEMKDYLKKTFGAKSGWKATNKEPAELPHIKTLRRKKTFIVERPNRRQAVLMLGHVADLRRNDADYPSVMVMNELLSGGIGSRLDQSVRVQKGLARTIRGFLEAPFDHPGFFACLAGTRSNRVKKAYEEIKAVISELREKGATPNEVRQAQEKLINAFIFNEDTPEKRLAGFMRYTYYDYPLNFTKKLFVSLKKVTAPDVTRVSKLFLDPKRLTVLVVGDSSRFDGKFEDARKLDITLPPPTSAPLVVDEKKETDGKKLLDRALEAAGGKNAFKAVKTIRLDVSFVVAGLNLRGCVRMRMPHLIRADVAGPFGPISQVMAQDKAWKAMGAWVQPMAQDEAMRNLRTLLLSDFGILYVYASGIEGVNVQKIESITDPNPTEDDPNAVRTLKGVILESKSIGRIRLYFDSDTDLPVLIKYSMGKSTKQIEKRFRDHRKFGDLILASKIADKNPATPVTLQATRVIFNPTLGDKLFTKPERALLPPPPPKESQEQKKVETQKGTEKK